MLKKRKKNEVTIYGKFVGKVIKKQKRAEFFHRVLEESV